MSFWRKMIILWLVFRITIGIHYFHFFTITTHLIKLNELLLFEISYSSLHSSKTIKQVTLVGSRGSSVGQVGVGDKIIAINHKKLQTIKDLNKQLAKPGKVRTSFFFYDF